MFKWQDSASKVSEAEDVQVFQTYNNNDEFYTKESINTLLEAMMKMSFDKINLKSFLQEALKIFLLMLLLEPRQQ